MLHENEQQHVMALSRFAMVDSNQGVDKSLDQNCIAKPEPSKVDFVSYLY